MLEQKLQQKLQQKLSPQQIQVIRLLEVPALEMEERIKQEIEANPALEEGEEMPHDEVSGAADQSEEEYNSNEDITLGDYRSDDDIPDYKLTEKMDAEERKNGFFYADTPTLHDMLTEQSHLRQLDEETRELVEYVIGNIDSAGYLRRSAESMVDDFSFQSGKIVSEEAVEEAVRLVQTFDPAGVGARSICECLLLQIERKKESRSLLNARRILCDGFEEFSKKNYDRLQRNLGLTEGELRDAISEIRKLNPKPGSICSSDVVSNGLQIVPDFNLENEDGTLTLTLNSHTIPPLRLNKEYTDMLDEYNNNRKNQTQDMKDAAIFVKQKLDSARWFINAVRQRQETLQRTMEAIISRQREFFLMGDERKLKPLILKDIADMTGYDVSTISRVSNSKYIQTEFGIFPLKYFFTEGMQNEQGEEISAAEVKSIVLECIQNEDKHNPLTDEKLTKLVCEKGYVVARRTIAKYREQAGFPPARLRKTI